MNLKKTICRALIASTMALSFQVATAGMIGADKAAPAQAQSDRTAVLAQLTRADTASKLEAMGVDPQRAMDRVAAMSDQEVTQLAQDMRNAPAGADGSGWVVALVIIAAVWYFAFRR
jgi:hypothetical protein